MGKVRLEREATDKRREEYTRKLTSAREQLTWDNFSSAPIDKVAMVKKTYNSFISLVQSYVISRLFMDRFKKYDTICINDMAYAVYNAAINPALRKEVVDTYGKEIQSSWNQINELCLDLKKYYKMKKSNRREILTTLDSFYGYELPIDLSFLDFTENPISDDEPISGSATTSCTQCDLQQDSTVYDMDWLYTFECMFM